MGERASRSVRKNRSRVRTASIATRRRFYAERAQPAAAPLRKVIKGKKHVFIPCVLEAAEM